jgi:ferric-dicitrate binding protein FerR (iron transport regulator)
MNDRHQDPELRARFEELKRVDASRAPSFARVMARVQAQVADAAASESQRAWRGAVRRHGWAGGLGGLAAAAAIAALIVIPRMKSEEKAFEQAVQAFETSPALGAWRSPTDALLNLPGSRLISTIPNMGTTQQ